MAVGVCITKRTQAYGASELFDACGTLQEPKAIDLTV
jgi:hypothetical protein